MEKSYLKINIIITYLVLLIIICIVLISCQKEDNTIDQTIANSRELDEYIIASADVQQTLNVFAFEFDKVDLLSLEIENSSDGKSVIHFPASIRELRIEEKILVMNEKKEALLRKYPQITTSAIRYVDYSINNSLTINNKFLEFGINIHSPLVKSGNSEFFSNFGAFADYLVTWMSNPNYTEVYIIAYQDGTKEIFQDSRNDYSNSYLSFTYNNGEATRGGKVISYVAHTHQNGNIPSTQDNSMATKYPQLKQGIYFNGKIDFFCNPW